MKNGNYHCIVKSSKILSLPKKQSSGTKPLHCANKLKILTVLWKTMKKLQDLKIVFLFSEVNITCLMAHLQIT